MSSISSGSNIKVRTLEFCSKIKINSPEIFKEKRRFSELIAQFIQQEYDLIPSKERIGKGVVYISKHIVKALFQYLGENSLYKIEDYYELGKIAFDSGEMNGNSRLQHFALIFLAEYVFNYPEQFDSILKDVLYYATNENWEIRETTVFIINLGMRKMPDHLLNVLSRLI